MGVALRCAAALLSGQDNGEAMVIGGAEIYRLILPEIDRMYFQSLCFGS